MRCRSRTAAILSSKIRSFRGKTREVVCLIVCAMALGGGVRSASAAGAAARKVVFEPSANTETMTSETRVRDLMSRIRAVCVALVCGAAVAAQQQATRSFDSNGVVIRIRSGPPKDEEADGARPVWAGVIPLQAQVLSPVPASDLVVSAGGFELARVRVP
jgi:hypothetical protein